MSSLTRLQQWYSRQCNGEWEHDQGISIESCDNPGWWVKINLTGTVLHQLTFPPVEEKDVDQAFQDCDRWLCCRTEDGKWTGAGDETKLERILELFLDWAESNGS